MTVLGIAGILCKLIGVLFTIPLTHLIGADGLGIFQGVFPTYNLLLTISSAGLPVAVHRMRFFPSHVSFFRHACQSCQSAGSYAWF